MNWAQSFELKPYFVSRCSVFSEPPRNIKHQIEKFLPLYGIFEPLKSTIKNISVFKIGFNKKLNYHGQVTFLQKN